MKIQRFFIVFLVFGLLISACAPAGSDKDLSLQDEIPVTETPGPLALWLPPYLPAQFTKGLTLPDEVFLSASEKNASIRIDVGSDALISQWVFALAAPFSDP